MNAEHHAQATGCYDIVAGTGHLSTLQTTSACLTCRFSHPCVLHFVHGILPGLSILTLRLSNLYSEALILTLDMYMHVKKLVMRLVLQCQ